MVRTPEHQFINFLTKRYHKLPDDDFYENINPYLKMWLYESWLYEQELEDEKLRNLALFIGSFSNPEMAKKIIKSENPDFKSSEEDFEKTTKYVRDTILEQEKGKKKKRKKRKVIK